MVKSISYCFDSTKFSANAVVDAVSRLINTKMDKNISPSEYLEMFCNNVNVLSHIGAGTLIRPHKIFVTQELTEMVTKQDEALDSQCAMANTRSQDSLLAMLF